MLLCLLFDPPYTSGAVAAADNSLPASLVGASYLGLRLDDCIHVWLYTAAGLAFKVLIFHHL